MALGALSLWMIHRLRSHVPPQVPKIIYLLISLFFFYYKFQSWQALQGSGQDFAHFDYALWNISVGNGPLLSIAQEDLFYENILGSHFSPVLYLFALPYYIFPSHFIPFLWQASIASLTLMLIYHLTRVFFPRDYLAQSLILIGFSFNLFFLNTFKFEFHPEILYIPLSILWLYFLSQNKLKGMVLISLAFFSIKEDGPLILLSAWCVFPLVKPSRKNFALSALMISVCVGYYILATRFFMPIWQLRSESTFTDIWSHYGSGTSEIVIGALTNPHLVLTDIFTNKSLYMLLLSFIFLPVASLYLAAAIVPIVILTTANYTYINTFSLYYSSYVVGYFVFNFLIGYQKIYYNKFRDHVLLAFVLISCLLGLGKFQTPSPNHKLLAEIADFQNETKDLLSQCGNESIFISGHLLSQLDYSSSYRRLTKLKTIYQYGCRLILLKNGPYDNFTESEYLTLVTPSGEDNPFMIEYESPSLVLLSRKK